MVYVNLFMSLRQYDDGTNVVVRIGGDVTAGEGVRVEEELAICVKRGAF